MSSIWDMIARERSALADYLSGISADAWESETLCAKWRVRDVAAHVIAIAKLNPLAFVWLLARCGFSVDKLTEKGVAERRRTSTALLQAELRDVASIRSGWFYAPIPLLVEAIVHRRYPLGTRGAGRARRRALHHGGQLLQEHGCAPVRQKAHRGPKTRGH